MSFGGALRAAALMSLVATEPAEGAEALASPSADTRVLKVSTPTPRLHGMPRNLTLLAIAGPDGQDTLGAKTAAGVIDVRAAAVALGLEGVPLTMSELLKGGAAASDALERLVKAAASSKAGLISDESQITHGRLFTNPGKILCVGLNYLKHAQECNMAPPRVPPLFSKFNNTLAGHGAAVKLPPADVAHKIDYETELLLVVGRTARDVPEAEALDYVAGYCVSNDLSARDLQLELPGVQWLLGKTLDGFCPVGPYFVSADQVEDPNALLLETYVNGELRQSCSTGDFIHNVQKIVAYISRHMTLEAGDLILTGTPHGVIVGLPEAQRVWLKAGDVVVSKIEKLGELKVTLA